MRAFVFQVIFKTASCLTSNFLWKLTKLTKIFFLHCTLYNVLRSELEPESAPGPWPPGAGAGAAQKSGGSVTLLYSKL